MFRPTYISTSAPTVDEDYSNGFIEGNFWFKSDTNQFYILEDHTTGAAAWTEVGGSSEITDWADWTPTLTWGTNNPSGVTYVARYHKVGNLVNFYVQINGTADGDCTDLSFTLPATPVDTNAYVPVNTWYIEAGTAGNDNIAYINSDDAVTRDVDHARFQTLENGNVFKLFFSGFYETS